VTVRDVETLEVLSDEPELLAIADAVGATQRRRRRRPPRRLLVAVAAVVAAGAVALVAPWEDDGASLVTERALAALPARGPVLHALLEYRYGEWVELRTGRPKQLLLRTEAWYDEERQLFRSRGWRGGRLLGDVTVDEAGDSLDAAMVSAFAQTADIVRRSLENGRMRLAGEDRVRGRDVYWLEAASPEDDNRVDVAVDRSTYELVQVRGRQPDSSFALTILTFEYLPRRAGIFGTPTRHGSDGLVPGSGFGAEVTSIGLPAARRALGREPAVWAGPAIAGKKLQAIEAHDVRPDSRPQRAKSGRALALTYGGGAGFGQPEPNAVSISQARDDEVGREYIGTDEVPPAGFAELKSGSTYVDDREFPRWKAVLRHGGLLVAIDGATRELVLDVARSLRPIPADAR
jgi:hypothetical protein